VTPSERDEAEEVRILSNRASSIPTIRQVVREAGVPAGELQTSYANAEAAWVDAFALADRHGRSDALDEIIDRRWPSVRGERMPAAGSRRERRLLPLVLGAAAAVVVAIADARTAFAGAPAAITGAGLGLLMAAGAMHAKLLETRRPLQALLAGALIVGGAAAGALLGT
jgi:hypothetical protein